MIVDNQYGGSILQGIAAVLSAVAWPALVATLIICYRRPLASILPILIDKFRSAGTVEFPGLKLTEATAFIQEAVQQVAQEPALDTVPESQVRRAQTLDAKLDSVGVTSSETASVVEAQVVQLGQEYEAIRSSMPSGQERTNEMNQVMAKMRTLGIRMSPLLDRMALSRKSGERLAAIASLQVRPDPKYLRWLTERFYVEVPFLFFHASLALSEYIQKSGLPDGLRADLQEALDHILKFPKPDPNTVRVLRQIV